jgi:hypothetical protein
MAKAKVSSEVSSAEIPAEGHVMHISKKEMREYFRVFPEERAKRAAAQAKRLHIRQEEAASRKREEEMILGPLEARLGIRADKPLSEGAAIEADESEVILSSIEEDSETLDDESDAFRDTYIYSIRGQVALRRKLDKWRKMYMSSLDLQRSGSFDEYVEKEGEKLIHESRKLVVKSRIRKFNKKNPGYDVKTYQEKKETDDKLYREVDMFIQANYEKLASYNTLEQKEQKLVFGRFWLLMQQNGVPNARRKDAEKLFLMIVGDVVFEAVTINTDYQRSYKWMIENANVEMSEEEWERRRQKAIMKNAEGELKEVLQEQTLKPVYTYNPLKAAPSLGYSSISEVARSGGVNFRPASGKGRDVYEVDFPYIREREARVYLRVIYPKGKEGKIDDAIFVLQDPYADKNAKRSGGIEQKAAEAVPTREVKAADIPRAMNILMLDYIMNKGVRTTEAVSGNPGINDVINDEEMVYMAERLFGFRLDDGKRHITEIELNLFKRFISVVIRDDGKTSLQDRVKRVRRELLAQDAVLPYFRETLKAPGSVTKTLDEVIEETKMRREGRFK